MPENLPRFDGQVCTALHCTALHCIVLTTPWWERRSACAGSAAAALAAACTLQALGTGHWLPACLPACLLLAQPTALQCAGAVVHLTRCSKARQPLLQSCSLCAAREHGRHPGLGVPAHALRGGAPLAGHPQEGLRQRGELQGRASFCHITVQLPPVPACLHRPDRCSLPPSSAPACLTQLSPLSVLPTGSLQPQPEGAQPRAGLPRRPLRPPGLL